MKPTFHATQPARLIGKDPESGAAIYSQLGSNFLVFPAAGWVSYKLPENLYRPWCSGSENVRLAIGWGIEYCPDWDA